MKRIGVLALQGAFSRHAEVVLALGHEPVLVRSPRDLADLSGLILPGGESTVQLRLMDRLGLEGPVAALVRSGLPVLATCAGAILLAKDVSQPVQRSLGLVDIGVVRNAWGRQLESFEAVSDDGLPLIFIRAPRIARVGDDAQVLARWSGEPILVRQGSVTCATFHPELTPDRRVHAGVFA